MMTNAQITGRSLSVADRRYDSDAFPVLLDYLGLTGLAIELDPEKSEPPAEKEVFTLQGAATLFGQPVVAELDVAPSEGGACDFQLVAKLPFLPEGVLPPGAFAAALAKAPNVSFAFASRDESAYFVLLESAADHDAIPALPLKRIGFEYLQSARTRATLAFNVHGEIDVGPTPVQVVLNAPLGGLLGPKLWKLTSPTVVPLGAGLAQMAQFIMKVAGVSAADATFPDSLEGISAFFLDELTVLLDPETFRVEFLTFRLTSVRPLVIIPDHLSIERTGVRVNVTPGGPDEETVAELTIFGILDIDEVAELDIELSVPSDFRNETWTFRVTGEAKLDKIDAVEKLPVGISREDLQLHPGFLELRALSLKLFEIDFDPSAGGVSSINLDVAVSATCNLTHGLSVSNPRFSLVSVNPFGKPAPMPTKELTGKIAAALTLGDIVFDLEVNKRKDGWNFVGQAEPGAIHMGQFFGSLAHEYKVALPEVIKRDVLLESLRLEFSTTTTQAAGSSSTVLFNTKVGFPLTDDADGGKVFLSFDAHVTEEPPTGEPPTPKYTREFGGTLTIGSAESGTAVEFGTRYSDDPKESFFVAAYAAAGQEPAKLSQLVANVSPTLASLIPDGLGIVLKDAVFAFAKAGQDARRFLLGIDLGIRLDLSRLPLVGKYFSGPGATQIGLDNLQVVFASQPFVEAEVRELNRLLSAFDPPVLPLPDTTRPEANPAAPGNAAPPNANTPVLRRGANVAAVLNLGATSKPLAFPTSPGPRQDYTGSQPTPNATTADSATWLNIQKAVGPLHFERVGVEYRDKKLWVLLSASLTAAGLSISLDGLSLGAPLDDLSKIEPALRGLGIDYRNDFVEIGGSFSRRSDSEYGGMAVLKARGVTVSAVGLYSDTDGDPSLFIYGLLDYPIGGPSFFFVTGLAAGFGYNRSLNVPPVEKLGRFSLLTAAQNSSKFTDVLKSPELAADIRKAAGEHFVAAGVIFTSFKLVESIVLLTAAFGKRFELHLLGLSKLRVPSELGEDVPPVAEVELALKGSFIPDDGFLELRAQLTPTSYLFKKDCYLTGGFAFLCWFKDAEKDAGPKAGEFVLTLGGYHPAFHAPAHYPNVPRLGFNWQVIPGTLSLSGDVYFALTPAAVMAGGHLQAEWRSGSIRAWFKAGVDFLIAWKPYYYDARAYIDIGVEVTFEFFGTQRLSLDVGADLHIWGPEFQGDATVHLWIISFTIHFGAGKASGPQAIGWGEFKQSFLPNKEEVCGVAVADGLVRKGKEGDKHDLGFINGKHFRLVTDSRIPSTDARCEVGTVSESGEFSPEKSTSFANILVVGKAGAAPPSFGIAPMGTRVSSSRQVVRIARKSGPVGAEFDLQPVTKNFPAALWGNSLTPSLNGPQFVDEALSGFVISVKTTKPPHETPPIDRGELLIADDSLPPTCHWGVAGRAFKGGAEFKPGEEDARKRNALLESLGMRPDGMRLDDKLTYQFLTPPQAEAA